VCQKGRYYKVGSRFRPEELEEALRKPEIREREPNKPRHQYQAPSKIEALETKKALEEGHV
jgi:hypothetical protein